MSNRANTPDEKFLLKLYEIAKDSPIDPKIIATAVGQKEHATKIIIKGLAQANLVIKSDDGKISLTKRGIQFVQDEFES